MDRIKALFDAERRSGTLCGRWCSDALWTLFLNRRVSIESGQKPIYRGKFNATMNHSKGFLDCTLFDGGNISGVFRVRYGHSYYYFVTKEGDLVEYPTQDETWLTSIKSFEKTILESLSPHALSSAAAPVPSPPPMSPSTAAKKSTGKRGHPDQRTPPSSEKRRRSIPIPVNMSDPQRNPTKIQGGVKAIQKIKSRAAEPWKKANKRLKGKFDQARDKICELKQAMSQLRKKLFTFLMNTTVGNQRIYRL